MCKGNPNLINHEQWGRNRDACLCKFPHTVISFMVNSQNSGGASEYNPPPSFSLLNRLTCFYFPHLSSFFLAFLALMLFSLSHLPLHSWSVNHNIFRVCGKVLIAVPAEPFSLIANKTKIVWDFDSYIQPPANTIPPPLGRLRSSFPFSSINFLHSLCFFMPFICIFIVSLLASLSLYLSFPHSVCLHLFLHFSFSLLLLLFFSVFCVRALSPVTIYDSGLNIAQKDIIRLSLHPVSLSPPYLLLSSSFFSIFSTHF